MSRFFSLDWILLGSLAPLIGAGLVTMYSFTGESAFFEKQVIWVVFGFLVCVALSFIDFRFLKRTDVILLLFFGSVFLLLLVFLVGQTVKGAQSWFDFGGFSFQPADPVKLVVILLLAKYFSRRHVEIAHIRHIIVSGFYVLIPFTLVFLQPDFGSAMIIGAIWFGMTLVSGISRKHLFLVIGGATVAFLLLWFFGFAPHQKERIATFLNPLTDLQGAGYNAFQSMVAVGSGEIFGKGVGFGTQSRLEFLPEYETDFIFAAFAEEWGFFGAGLMLLCFGILLYRILFSAMRGETNFEMLYGYGLAIFFLAHITIHIGMNIGLLPVTGLPLPFVSYGGSHILTEFIGIGILLGMRRYARAAHRDDMKNEFLGIA